MCMASAQLRQGTHSGKSNFSMQCWTKVVMAVHDYHKGFTGQLEGDQGLSKEASHLTTQEL
jgi:hypothetical protein